MVGFRLLCQADALEVEPLILAIWRIACNHISVRNILAEAVSLLDLVANRSPAAAWFLVRKVPNLVLRNDALLRQVLLLLLALLEFLISKKLLKEVFRLRSIVLDAP
jgi:hypothetical protein